MDLKKADIGTVIEFGTLDDFAYKLELESQNLSDIIDHVNPDGVSLLQKALVGRKFDNAKFLMNNGAKVNVITKAGNNELHCLAANINFDGALDLARLLIDRGVDLNHIDKKYGNPAVFSIFLELLKRQSQEGMKFIEEILSYKLDIDIVNKSGISARKLLIERGNDSIKKIVEAI